MLGVSISIDGNRLVQNLNLRVASGEIVVFMGASGSGKSSFLSYLCGTLPPSLQGSGRIIIDGDDITSLPVHMRRIGLLFQDDLLFPHMSVGENLAFALRARTTKKNKEAIRKSVTLALQQADLAGFAERDPSSLSGGQKARVSVMRCLLAQPRVLLLDEPFSRLDIPLRKNFRKFVFRKVIEQRVPTILVTHDPADAQASGGKKFSMERLAIEKLPLGEK